MSYSFQIRAATKGAAVLAVCKKFDEIVEQQPVHARDSSAVIANAQSVIGLLAEDETYGETKEVSVMCNGYVSWTKGATAADAEFGSVSISCSAGYIDRI